MAFDAFLIFGKSGVGTPVKGESKDKAFDGKGAFEISEFSFGAENTVSLGSASGGGGAGKTTFKEFTVKKLTDSGSCPLFKSLAEGGHFAGVFLYLRKSGGQAGKSGDIYMKFAFGTVVVKSMEWSGATGDDMPTESVVFEYGQLAVNYFMQAKDGKIPGAPTGAASWDRVANEEVGASIIEGVSDVLNLPAIAGLPAQS